MIQLCITETGDPLGRINPEIDIIRDHVFLLSDAAINVFFPTAFSRIIRNTPDDASINPKSTKKNIGDWWWTRTPGRKRENIICVDPNGEIDRNGRWSFSDVCAIRPALILNLCSIPANTVQVVK